MTEAAHALVEHERYKTVPNDGGMDDQPVQWKLNIDCAYAALDDAREDIRREEEQRRIEEEHERFLEQAG